MRISVDLQCPDPDVLQQAADCFARGGLVVYPTDTIYGIGCNPFHHQATTALSQLKQRDAVQPLLLLIDEPQWVERLSSDVPSVFHEVAARWWPGPLTLALPAATGLPGCVVSDQHTVAFRLPALDWVRQLVAGCGFPICSTSVNRTGESPQHDPAQLWQNWGNHIDLFLDAGPLAQSRPSTLLDLSQNPPRLLRHGSQAPEIEGWLRARRNQ